MNMAEVYTTYTDELLAETVKTYKCLYDKSCADFKNKIKTNRCWIIVASKLNLKTGTAAQTKFRNLRKRYTKAKKCYQAANRSGTSTKSVEKARQKLDEFNYLSWLDDFIKQRATKTNVEDSDVDDFYGLFDDDDDADLDTANVESDHDDVDVDVDVEDSLDTQAPQQPDEENNGELLTQSDIAIVPTERVRKDNLPNISKNPRITKSKKVKNWEKTRDIEKEEISVMRALTKKIESDTATKRDEQRERDTCEIYGELVAAKLRKLSPDSQEEAQLAIDTLLMNQRMKDQQSNIARPSLTVDTSPQIPYFQPRRRFDLSPVNYNSSPNQFVSSHRPGLFNAPGSDRMSWIATSTPVPHTPSPTFQGFCQDSAGPSNIDS